MKYNQPYDQPSAPNAPYVDGNPSAGIQGSIVPAASIEYPQREIMAAIQAAGLSGTNSDLSQLLQMLKIMDVFNHFKFAVNAGNAAQWSATIPALPIMPPPDGTTIWFRPGYASMPGGTVFSVNGSAFAPVVHPDLQPVTEGDIIATGWVLLLFYQGNWQIVNAGGASTRVTGALPMLQKNTDWYVNGTTGDDTNYDGTSATVVTAKIGPFKTIQRASDEVLKYNMNNYNQIIHIADGTYVGPTSFRALNGTGWVYVKGNIAAPQNVTITVPAGANTWSAFFQTGGYYDYDGLRFTTPAGNLDGLTIVGGYAACHNLRFGPCARFHLAVGNSGASCIVSQGTFTIEAGANALRHLHAEVEGSLAFPGAFPALWPSLNILGAVTFSQGFIGGHALGVASMHYASIGGGGFVTGPQYIAFANGIVDSGSGGANYFPGNAAGSVSQGGQYIA
jgi:hypothetical protein